MLGLASDPELITDIIARLSPSDALTTAKAVEDADLRNRLVRRALNSSYSSCGGQWPETDQKRARCSCRSPASSSTGQRRLTC